MNRRSFMSTVLALGAAPLSPPPASGVFLKQGSAVTWERFDVPPFPRSIMGPVPYGGTKHSRWARRTVDGCWYVLGGDYSLAGLNVSGSGSNLLWKVTPGKPFTFVQLNKYVPAVGQKIPNRVDEAPWMYDSKRDRFLLFPYPRWCATASADCIVGHLMFYYPATNRWVDAGTGQYTGDTNVYDPTNNPQFDVNGHQYPINTAKWGVYDDLTDKFYIPQGDSHLMVLDAQTLAMEWPIQGVGYGAPWTFYNQSFYTACLCFDKKRRRLVTIKSANNGDYLSDPNAFKLVAVDLDTRKVYAIPSSDYPFDPVNPLYIDFEALVHDEVNDRYLLYGGGYRIGGSQDNLQPTNDLRALPAQGGDWTKLLPTGIAPPQRYGQTMHWEPSLGQFFELGGITDTAPQVPEMFFLTFNKNMASPAVHADRPAWRRAMVANTWVAIPSLNKLSDLDPTASAATNRNYPAIAEYAAGTSAALLAYSGACWDEAAGTYWWPLQGGHGDYGGNEPYKILLRANSPQWIRLRPPSGWNGTVTTRDGQDATGLYSDGRLRSTHAYNNNVYVPGLGPVITRMGANWHNAASTNKAYLLNETTGDATLILDYSGSANLGAAYGGACYDPSRNCIWMLGLGGGCKLQQLDLAANTLTGRGTADTHAAGVARLVYLPRHDVLVLAASSTTYATWFSVFDLSTFAHTGPTITGSFSTGLDLTSDNNAGKPALGMGWDDVNNRLLLWNNATARTEISTLTPTGDPRSANWTAGTLTLSASNKVTPTTAHPNGCYSRFVYSPGLGGCFVLNATKEPIYFYATE